MKYISLSIKPNTASSTLKVIRMKVKKTEKPKSNQLHFHELELLSSKGVGRKISKDGATEKTRPKNSTIKPFSTLSVYHV